MDYTKELTIFKGQKKWQTPPETGNIKVRVISKPQPVKLTYIDETGANPGITVISRESDEVRPMLDVKNDVVIDNFKVPMQEPSEFLIVKPLKHDRVYLDLTWGGTQVPLMLPREFFTFDEPIQIMTGSLIKQQAFTIPVIAPDISGNDNVTDFDNSMIMTEIPADVVRKSGLSEGTQELANLYDKTDFIKSFCTNAIGGGTGGVVNNIDLLKEFFPGKKFYIKQYNGKYFVVFKGFAGTRAVYNGTTYRLNNPKVMALSAAKSPTAGAAAALKGLKPALKGNILTVVIIGAVDLVAWQNGVLSDDGKFISDFIVEFGMDVAKTVVSTVVAGIVTGFFCVFLGGAIATSFSVVVIVAGGIAISIMVGMLLDYIDEKAGITTGLRNTGNNVEKSLIDAFDENIVAPISEGLYNLERHIGLLYMKQFDYIPFR